ncbi:MAG: thermonuclease family protein [Pseudomonadota bacterium]
MTPIRMNPTLRDKPGPCRRRRPFWGLLGPLLLAAGLCLVPAANAETPAKARVFRIFDGDSFLARDRGRSYRVRIHGTDAPELDQPHGDASLQILEKMIRGKRVRVEAVGEAVEGYQAAHVHWEDYDIGAELVRTGAAWALPGDDERAQQLAALEQEAREQRRGLWADTPAMPPWEWRGRAESE